jgi:hypothetical protein
MYCFQNFRSSMSALLNFQFFSGFINTSQKALPLLLFREVEEELDDASAVGAKVFLKIRDRTVTIVPDRFVIVGSFRNTFAEQNFGMHAGNQNLLAIGSVEDSDSPAFRKVAGGRARGNRAAVHRHWDV